MIISSQYSVLELALSLSELQRCINLLDENNIRYKVNGDFLEEPNYVIINLEIVCLADLIFLVDNNLMTQEDYKCIFDSEVSAIHIHRDSLI